MLFVYAGIWNMIFKITEINNSSAVFLSLQKFILVEVELLGQVPGTISMWIPVETI